MHLLNFATTSWLCTQLTRKTLNAQQPPAKQSLCEGSVPIAWRATDAMNTILSPCRPHRVKPCLLTERALRGARRRYVNTTWQPRRRRRRLPLRVPLRLCSSRLSFPFRSRSMGTFRSTYATYLDRSKIVDGRVRQIMLKKIDVIYSGIKPELRAILSGTGSYSGLNR